jgi:hypothetical protein
MPTSYFDAVIEDYRHSIFENRERQGAKEKHSNEQNATNDLFMGEEGPDFIDQSA